MAGADVFRFGDAIRDLNFRPVAGGAGEVLTAEEVDRYNRDGFLQPITVLDREEATDLRTYFDWLVDEVVSADDRRNGYSINNYHQVCERLHRLISHPTVVAYATDILGPQAVCWSTHAFCKLPNDGMEVPLHQDALYWPFTPTRSVTIWLAVDDVDTENAAMRFVPGSHVIGPLDHDELPLDGTVVLNRRVSPDAAIEKNAMENTIANELNAGQASLHTDLLLHGSYANTSKRRRCGIAIRFVGAEVRAVEGQEGWTKAAVHVADGDPSGYWPNVPRPSGEDPHRMSCSLAASTATFS